MAYRNFVINVLIRLTGILVAFAIIFVLLQYFDKSQMIVSLFMVLIVISILIYELIRYVLKFARDIANFFDSIRQHNFQLHFDLTGKSGQEKLLYKSLNSIIDEFKNIKIEKEVQYNFLQRIVEIVDIGLLVFDRDENIVLMNSAATNILGVRRKATVSQLRDKNPEIVDAITGDNIKGDITFEQEHKGNSQTIIIHKHETILNNNRHMIITLQDIRKEIDRKEVDSWIKIIRTLNHEIMNSLTPVSSLAGTLKLLVTEPEGNVLKPADLSESQVNDIYNSAVTIESRSRGLIKFVDEYRKLTRIPEPVIVPVNLSEVISESRLLFNNDIKRLEIGFNTTIPSEKYIRADRGLISQVIINIIKNCIDALEKSYKPEIIISISSDKDYEYIQVKDNGSGFDPNEKNNLFVPFYTTRKSGTGIGLSLSRQILLAHQGSINIERENEYTIINIKLPA